jgi:hypothetical protein
VALMRVYCGLAAARPAVTGAMARGAGNGAWLTAAVVDDAGRLLDVCAISDDAAGYAELGTLLAERSGGGAGIAVAADNDEHEITLLLAAAGRLLAIVDDEMVVDYAERFADDESAEEMAARPDVRYAVGLARALQAGALAAAGQSAPRELMALKPVLAAHAAMVVSRHGAAVALREVLRELYPAALRAYPDPAESIPLAILDALPEPGLLGTTNRGRDAAVAADLAGSGMADATTIGEAITALRVAAAETPRRTGIGKGTTSAVAETIRQSVAAVRACDAAITSLIGLLDNAVAHRVADPMPLRAIGPRAIEPARTDSARHSGDTDSGRDGGRSQESARHDAARASRRTRSAPAPRSVSSPPAVAPASEAPAARSHRAPMQRSTRRQSEPSETSFAAAGAYGASEGGLTPSWSTESAETYPRPAGSQDSGGVAATNGFPQRPPYPGADRPTAGRPATPDNDYRGASSANGYSPYGDPIGTGQYPSNGVPGPGMPTAGGRPAPDYPAPGSRSTWPLNPPGPDDDLAQPALPERPAWQNSGPSWDATQTAARDGQPSWSDAQPSWQGSQPTWQESAPGRRAADSRGGGRHNATPPTDERDSGIPRQRERRVAPPWQTDDLTPPAEPPSLRLVDPPVLRLVGSDGTPEQSTRTTRNGRRESDDILTSTTPMASGMDDDLLIFAEARSAWFIEPQEGETAPSWSDADQGWHAAERASHPTSDGETDVGLPRRVPKANLVPGSPLPPAADNGLHIIRDPASMAAHTTGYFRGSRRGEEVRGYAVGGRPGRESGDGWDFSRDGWDLDDEPEYRSAAHR